MQQFINNITLTFNLRQVKKDKPTIIYIIVRVNGKQYKYNSGVKVYPQHYNSKQQAAIINYRLSNIDFANNLAANKRLQEIKNNFNTLLDYLHSNPSQINNIQPLIKTFLGVEDKTTKTATQLLQEVFAIKYPNDNNTTRFFGYQLRCIVRYIESNTDNKPSVLSQNLVNDYRDYLVDEAIKLAATDPIKRGYGISNINTKCLLLARLINAISAHKQYRLYNISQVKYNSLKDNRDKDDTKKVALTDEEVAAIAALNLNGSVDVARDIFLFLLECGQRISDFNASFMAISGKNVGEVIIIKTQKESTISVITITDEMARIWCKYNGIIPKYDLVTINRDLKEIAKMANLDRTIKYKQQKGNKEIEMEAPLYNLLSTHYARHTFITNKIKEGWSADRLCFVTGHCDDEMIKQIYTHLTEKDKIDMVVKEKERLNKIINPKQ